MTNEPQQDADENEVEYTSYIQISFASSFEKDIKRLRKKYPHIGQDIQPLIERLTAGETPGTQVQATGYTVYKVRLSNSDISRGKSVGYWVLYYIRTPQAIILLTIYSKTEQSDTPTSRIKQLIDSLPDEDTN